MIDCKVWKGLTSVVKGAFANCDWYQHGMPFWPQNGHSDVILMSSFGEIKRGEKVEEKKRGGKICVISYGHKNEECKRKK